MIKIEGRYTSKYQIKYMTKLKDKIIRFQNTKDWPLDNHYKNKFIRDIMFVWYSWIL